MSTSTPAPDPWAPRPNLDEDTQGVPDGPEERYALRDEEEKLPSEERHEEPDPFEEQPLSEQEAAERRPSPGMHVERPGTSDPEGRGHEFPWEREDPDEERP